jgi:NAD(P)-dependent dehydrogenase (short-subunit alcohol dehydrogenase family)
MTGSRMPKLSRPRRWLITGAGSGIGRALTDEVLAQGDRVVATVRREGSRQELKAVFGDRIDVELLDLTDASAIADIGAKVAGRGPIDVLVNNAGYAVIGAAEEMTDTQVRAQLDSMLLGPILLTRAVLPAMRAAREGLIINFSSVGGQTAGPGGSLYNAAKWGLEGFTESLAGEVAPLGINVSLIEPGTIRTGFLAALQQTEPLDDYRDGPVGAFRDYLETHSDNPADGDPDRLARVVVSLSRLARPPLRLALGGDAFTAIEAAYESRLVSLRTHRDVSYSVAFNADWEVPFTD